MLLLPIAIFVIALILLVAFAVVSAIRFIVSIVTGG